MQQEEATHAISSVHERFEQQEVKWGLIFLIPAYTEFLTATKVSSAQRCEIRACVQEEEAARKAEEEEAQLAAEREQRKADRAARRAEAKRQGLLLTGKAKKEAERLAALREQLLAKAGVEIASAPSGEVNLRARTSISSPADILVKAAKIRGQGQRA